MRRTSGQATTRDKRSTPPNPSRWQRFSGHATRAQTPGTPHRGTACFHPGSERTSEGGSPKICKIRVKTAASVSAPNNGRVFPNSPNMHPVAHTSTGRPNRGLPSNNSGALYQRVPSNTPLRLSHRTSLGSRQASCSKLALPKSAMRTRRPQRVYGPPTPACAAQGPTSCLSCAFARRGPHATPSRACAQLELRPLEEMSQSCMPTCPPCIAKPAPEAAMPTLLHAHELRLSQATRNHALHEAIARLHVAVNDVESM